MPGYKQHISCGFLCSFLVLICFSFGPFSLASVIEWSLCTLLGSLFPDIDIKSKGQFIFYTLFFVLLFYMIVLQKWIYVSLLAMISYIPILSKHRGIFHNFWFITTLVILLLALVKYTYPDYYILISYDAFFFMIGVFSHLLLDKGFLKTLKL